MSGEYYFEEVFEWRKTDSLEFDVNKKKTFLHDVITVENIFLGS